MSYNKSSVYEYGGITLDMFSDELLNSGKEILEIGLENFLPIVEHVNKEGMCGLIEYEDVLDLFIGHVVMSDLIRGDELLDGYGDDIVVLSSYLYSCKEKIDRIGLEKLSGETYLFAFETEDKFITLRVDEVVSIYEEMCSFERVMENRVRELIELGQVDFREYFVDFNRIGRFFKAIDGGVPLSYVCSIPEEHLRELSDHYEFLYEICAEELALSELREVSDKVDMIKNSIEKISLIIAEFNPLDEIPIFDTLGERVDMGIAFKDFKVGPSRFDIGLWTILDGISIMESRIDDIECEIEGRG